MDSHGALLKFPLFSDVFHSLFALRVHQTSCSNNIVSMKGNIIWVSWMSERKSKKTDEHPKNSNRFFQLHQAVVCYSISPVSVLSIFVHLHRRDGSDLHPCYLSPAAVYKTSFLINSVFSVSNCHLPVMKINVACLIWSGDQYSSDTCMYRLQATVKCNIHFPIARTQCKGLTVTQNVCWNFCISTNEGPS